MVLDAELMAGLVWMCSLAGLAILGIVGEPVVRRCTAARRARRARRREGGGVEPGHCQRCGACLGRPEEHARGYCRGCLRVDDVRLDVIGGLRSDWPGMEQARGVERLASLQATGELLMGWEAFLFAVYRARYLGDERYERWLAEEPE